jgi:NADH:ubiquinone oxidoreductase subunit 3 (subunit A)
MFPHLSDSWLVILIACFFGFVIGQWIKARRNRAEKNNDYVSGLKKRLLAEQSGQTRKANKKIRRAHKKSSGS